MADRDCPGPRRELGVGKRRARHLVWLARLDSVVIPIAVVIAVIPIAFIVPAAIMFVPPAMVGIPAAFARLSEFTPGMIGLSATPSVTRDGPIEFLISADNAALTIVIVSARR